MFAAVKKSEDSLVFKEGCTVDVLMREFGVFDCKFFERLNKGKIGKVVG